MKDPLHRKRGQGPVAQEPWDDALMGDEEWCATLAGRYARSDRAVYSYEEYMALMRDLWETVVRLKRGL